MTDAAAEDSFAAISENGRVRVEYATHLYAGRAANGAE